MVSFWQIIGGFGKYIGKSGKRAKNMVSFLELGAENDRIGALF